MRRESGNLLYSPTDLVSFLGCAHSTVLDLAQLEAVADIPPADDDEYLELLQIKGLEHERAYLDSLRNSGLEVVEIPAGPSLPDRVALTQSAMVKGADVIYQGALFSAPWAGYSDFLIKVPGSPSTFGNYRYEAVDTKLSGSAKPKHVIQLSVYSNLLAIAQGAPPDAMHIVVGDGSKVSLRVQDFVHYCEIARRRFLDFLTPPVDATVAEPCGHCAFCRWAEKCDAEWDAADHLSIVANITRAQIAKLRVEGVGDMKVLASLDAERKISRMQPTTTARLRDQARLQVAKRAGGPDTCEILALENGRGFARLPKPNAGDLFFDIEGDPLFDDGPLDYLFGFDHVDGGEVKFTAFWAHSRTEEKIAFQRLMDFITVRLARYPDAHVYHYAAYEETALKRLAMLHGTREVEVDNLLRGRKLVDLYKVVREGLRVSEPAYSIKNLETFYWPERRGAIKGGGESIVAYEQWRGLGDERLLKNILDYNEVDCKSTRGCRNWLLSLRPAEVEWFDATAEAEKPEAVEDRRQSELASAALVERLLGGVAERDRSWRELLGQLVDFHKREAKPEWWRMFERQDMSLEELMDDRSSLADLRPDDGTPAYPEKRSMVYTFRFPDQDYRIKVGDRVKRAGVDEGTDEVFAIDDDARTVSIKCSKPRQTFDYPLSLIPNGPISEKVLREAVFRYSTAVADGREDEFPALTDLLRNELAREHSYSLIQGPPGAGKTYQSSKRIVELLGKGFRVGVSSNSHKAICNLLSAIEERAAEQRVSFRGIKKSTTEDQCFNGRGLVEDVCQDKEIDYSRYALVAGTVFLFARPEFDATLDYLFIDEAGQVSLANVVAMGMCAKHLVLVGDQMQLSQPLQGAHPGNSGLSVLEHLLGDRAIVPEDRGEFLAETRRLHPDVCRFISDAVYDGKLRAAEGNERQRLVLSDTADLRALAPSGIRFVDVDHQGCDQDCEAEAARLVATYESLLMQRWIDRDGVESPIESKDVLVVTPWNAQVALLRERLPKGARIGTVDKFQGQEAAVVLISMATSSGEDLPRDMSFLFSRNRLNVAISRARCLAVIYASPRLLEVSCNTLEQMRLVNTLCWAKIYSEGLARPTPFDRDGSVGARH